jgi:septation ring formation regulator EzrA
MNKGNGVTGRDCGGETCIAQSFDSAMEQINRSIASHEVRFCALEANIQKATDRMQLIISDMVRTLEKERMEATGLLIRFEKAVKEVQPRRKR